MKHISSLALAAALITAPQTSWAVAGPHCAVAPVQIAAPAAGAAGAAGAGKGGTTALETPLPAPVLPSGNVSRPPLTAATLAATGIDAASSDAAPAVALNDSRSPPVLQPIPKAFPVPAKTEKPNDPTAALPVGIDHGPPHLPLVEISSKVIAASPALTRIASKGAQLYALGVSHGMQGVFARHGQYFQVFYITPDGNAAIAGIMWNAKGRNVTLREVRHVPGLMPTVKIGSVAGHPVARHVAYRVPVTTSDGSASTVNTKGASPGGLPSGSLFEALAMSDHGTIGKPGAPRVWMMMDPLCSYSIAAMRQVMPAVQAGKLRVSVVPLSILDYEDHGASTAQAKIMLSQPPKLMAADWIDRGLVGEVATVDAGRKLAFNMSIARAVGLKGTPTFFWRTKTGAVGRSNGLPPSLTALIASIRTPS